MKRLYSVFLALFLLSLQSLLALNTGDVLIERVSSPHFYIETTNPTAYAAAALNTPRAAYVAFKVTNTSGATIKGLKAKLGTFLTVPGLATPAGTLGLVGGTALESQDIGVLAPGQSDILYWLVQYPKQAISGGQPISCRMTLTVTDLFPGNVSLCEVPGITMRTIVSTGAASSTTIGACTRTANSVVGGINEETITYNYSNVASGDEINLQPTGNLSFLASLFQLTNVQIISSTVPGISAGDIDKIYHLVSAPAANASITVRYYFNNAATGTNPIATTLLNPYTVQSGSPGTTSIYPTNYINAAASITFPTYNTLPFTIAKYSLNPVSAPGAIVTYRVVVRNNSAFRAAFQRIEDVMPRGFTFIGTTAGGLSTVQCSNTPTAGFVNTTGTVPMAWSGFVDNSIFPFKEFVVASHDSVSLYYQAQIPNPTGLNKLFINSVKIYYGSYSTANVVSNICVNCGDVDNDGSFDMVDEDDDNDGVQDNYEICGGCYGTNPMGDDDDDMILNYADVNTAGFADLNGDGINDHWDFDMDGIINTLDRDSDNDGISDLVEAGGVDVDSDGKMDIFADVDGDGVADLYDADYNVPIQTWDSDHDGNYNYLDMDSDYDGVQDISEAGYPDVDGNGKIDAAINVNGICACVIGSNARIISGADTDMDNIPNSYLSGDSDGDGRPDYMDIDSDGDGIVDLLETQPSSSSYIDIFGGLNVPIGTDANQNGLDDVFENNPTVLQNSDGAGTQNATSGGYDDIPDYLDVDSDNDGIADQMEAYDGDYDGYQDVLPFGFDSDQDGLDDAFDTFDMFSAIGGQSGTAQDNIRGTNASLSEDTNIGLPSRLFRSFSQPLPVILKDLKAVPTSKSILVTWNTLSEINSDYFTVERSIDGVNFNALGNVNSVGGINTKTGYVYDDKNAINEDIVVVFYRIKMVDKNGAFTYSDRVSATLPTADLAVSVFPNPATSELNISYYTKEVSDVTLKINSVTGKEVYSNAIKGGQLMQNAKVDVSNFPTGIYFLTIKNAGGNKVVKFVVE